MVNARAQQTLDTHQRTCLNPERRKMEAECGPSIGPLCAARVTRVQKCGKAEACISHLSAFFAGCIEAELTHGVQRAWLLLGWGDPNMFFVWDPFLLHSLSSLHCRRRYNRLCSLITSACPNPGRTDSYVHSEPSIAVAFITADLLKDAAAATCYPMLLLIFVLFP